MVSIRLKKITLMVLVASFCLSLAPLLRAGRNGNRNFSSNSSFSFPSFSLSSAKNNPWAAAACAVVGLGPWFWLGSRLSEVNKTDKSLQDGKLYLGRKNSLANWAYESTCNLYWPNAREANEYRGPLEKALYDQYVAANPNVPLLANMDGKGWGPLLRHCDIELTTLGQHITSLQKSAPKFIDYSIAIEDNFGHSPVGHGSTYTSFIESVTGKKIFRQTSWETNDFTAVDSAVDKLVQESSSWLGNFIRSVLPFAAIIPGLYTGGETGGLIAAGYGAVTATAWLYTASFENKKMADATKLCWQCIKKFERLQAIKNIIKEHNKEKFVVLVQ